MGIKAANNRISEEKDETNIFFLENYAKNCRIA